MKKCVSCGNDNLDSANFCDSCGGPLGQAPAMAPSMTPPPPPPTPAWQPGPAAPPQAPPPAAPYAAPPPQAVQPRAMLRVDASGREFMLEPGRESIIGRGDRARGLVPDVELSEGNALAQGVSRLHAKIIYRDGFFYVIDLNSTNSTYLNRNKLAPQQPYSLQNGDQLELGNFRISFFQLG